MSKRLEIVALAAIVVATIVPTFWTVRGYDCFDSAEYVQLSATWWHEKRLPFFPMLIALVHQFIGDPSLAGKLVARACGSGLVVAAWAMVRELFGATTALVAALLVAACPLGIFVSSIVHPLPLFSLLLTTAAWGLVRHVRGGGAAPLLLANVLVALACFTRPEGFAVVPLLLGFDVRAVRRAKARAPTLVAIAAGVAAQAGAAAYFLRHFWYGETGIETLVTSGFVSHVVDWGIGYLRVLPSTLSYTAFPFVLFGAWTLFRRWRRGELDVGQATFLLSAAWVFAGVFAVLAAWFFFAGLYLMTPLPLALCVAAVGIERFAALFRRPAVARALALVAVLAVDLPFAFATLREYAPLLRDAHDCGVWLKEQLRDSPPEAGAEADARSRIRKPVVLAVDTNHLFYWTGLVASRYQRRLVERARWIVLSDVVLDHYGFDYDAELAWLLNERGARIAFRSESASRPLLATTLCKPYSSYGTPRIVDLRFDLHHFRSVVLEMPGKRGRDR